jgi:hypothetical protein
MGELKRSEIGDLVDLFHSNTGKLIIPKPFEHDIFLSNTYVAGSSHIERIEELALSINKGDNLRLVRDPHNTFDSNAIIVQNSDSIKLGFIPRNNNETFARLMDDCKILFGTVQEKELRGRWVNILIKVYMKD